MKINEKNITVQNPRNPAKKDMLLILKRFFLFLPC